MMSGGNAVTFINAAAVKDFSLKLKEMFKTFSSACLISTVCDFVLSHLIIKR